MVWYGLKGRNQGRRRKKGDISPTEMRGFSVLSVIHLRIVILFIIILCLVKNVDDVWYWSILFTLTYSIIYILYNVYNKKFGFK